VIRTSGTYSPITFGEWFMQKVLGFNRGAYWQMHFTSIVEHPSRVRVGVGTAPGQSPGCYLEATNGIEVGDYTMIAPSVGLISANRDSCCLNRYCDSASLRIGNYCWIGMNAVILSGVELGDHTVVAAGAVVNRSFPEGYCVLAGVPAKVVKQLDPSKVVRYHFPFEYVGYFAVRNRSKEELYRRLGVSVDGRAGPGKNAAVANAHRSIPEQQLPGRRGPDA
jgi:acetyltransferase-like isoleucine patch superfamily enzyme